MMLEDVAAIQSLNGNVLLAGDFNARTSTLADFMLPSEYADMLLQPDLLIPEALPHNIPDRHSADQGPPNHFGQKLLALCQDSNLLILNGRVVGDEQGCLTCHTPNGASLVDYFIASPSLLSLTPSLHVQGRQPDSDHCPLLLQIPRLHQAPTPPGPCSDRKPVKLSYKADKVETYRCALAETLNFHFSTDAPLSMQCYATTMQECIVSAASQTHGYQRSKVHSRPTQPWYDDECKAIRKHLHGTPHDDPAYKQPCKEYARVKRRKRRQAELAAQHNLCEQACHNARAFWCKYRKRDMILGNIPSQQWLSAFKDLFGPEAGPATSHEEQGQPQGENPELNEPVTAEEVTAAFLRLKRHKAAGIDGIKAEFLLDAEDMLIPWLLPSHRCCIMVYHRAGAWGGYTQFSKLVMQMTPATTVA